MPKFTKKEEELKTIEDQWYYFFKHAAESNQIIPALASTSEICDAYDIVERFSWTEQELRSYDNNMMALRDARSRLEGVREEGREEGREEERKKIIQNLIADRFPLAIISKITGCSEKELVSIADQTQGKRR